MMLVLNCWPEWFDICWCFNNSVYSNCWFWVIESWSSNYSKLIQTAIVHDGPEAEKRQILMVADASTQKAPRFGALVPAGFRTSWETCINMLSVSMCFTLQIFSSPLGLITFIFICNMLSIYHPFPKCFPNKFLYSIYMVNKTVAVSNRFSFHGNGTNASSKPPLLGRHGHGAARRFATQNFAVSVALWTGAVLIGSCLQRCIL